MSRPVRRHPDHFAASLSLLLCLLALMLFAFAALPAKAQDDLGGGDPVVIGPTLPISGPSPQPVPLVEMFIDWIPDYTVDGPGLLTWYSVPFTSEYKTSRKPNADGTIGTEANITLRAPCWLKYEITPLGDASDYWWEGYWYCHVSRSYVALHLSEMRYHQDAGTAEDTVYKPDNTGQSLGSLDGYYGDPAYGEYNASTTSCGKYHMTAPNYAVTSTLWGRSIPMYPYGPFPNGPYTITAKVNYTVVAQEYDIFLPLGGYWPIDGQGPPYDVYAGPDVVYDGSPTSLHLTSTQTTQEVTKTMHVTLQNLVISQITPDNPQPVFWDPATMTTFPLTLKLEAAYTSERVVRASVYDVNGKTVANFSKDYIGKQDIIDFGWNGYVRQSGYVPYTLPKGIYFFSADCYDMGGTWDGDQDKSQTTQIYSDHTGASQISDDGQNVVCQMEYFIHHYDSSKPLYQGSIDVYDQDYNKVVSQPLGNDDLTNGQHDVAVTMPEPAEDGGLYTFVVNAQDDDADTDKASRRRWACQGAQVYIRWLGASGTNVPGSFFYIPVPNAQPQASATVVFTPVTSVGTPSGAADSFTINGPIVPGSTFSFVWDSTHFPDRTNLRIGVADPAQNIKYRWVQIYNKAYVLANKDTLPQTPFGQKPLLDQISGDLQQMNHTVGQSDKDDGPTIAANLRFPTVFYIRSHGSPGSFQDCIAKYRIKASDITNKLQVKVDPAYNLVFIDGCNVGETTDIAVAFGVSDAAGATKKPDHAFLGWKTKVNVSQKSIAWTKRVFDYLAQGYTVAFMNFVPHPA